MGGTQLYLRSHRMKGLSTKELYDKYILLPLSLSENVAHPRFTS